MGPRDRRRARLAAAGVVVLLLAAASLVAARSATPPPRVVLTDLVATAGARVPAVDVVPVVEDAAAVPTAPAIPVAEPPTPGDGPADAGEAGAPPVPEVATAPVTSARAAVVATLAGEGEEDAARDLLADLDGVDAVAAVTVVATRLGGVPAEVALVDIEPFRPFTPEATANHPPLWTRVAAGDVAVTHEWGTTHQVVLGTEVAGPAGPVRIGAFASNGTPPVADAVMAAGALPADGGTRLLLIALDAAASPTAVVQALARVGVDAEEIPDPRAPRDEVVIPAGGITPENVWDHLAVCEASGNWQINTGNGYYGGLQFLPESWWLVGGTGLPHEHPREEQIYRASLLWQIQGWEAWPQCARRLGLIGS